jgi:CRP-like cAMP-binding protein
MLTPNVPFRGVEGLVRMAENLILRSLPAEEIAGLSDPLPNIRLEPQSVLYRRGEPIEHVYFLDSGIVSLLALGEDGRAIETGIVGREGVVGANVILGNGTQNAQAIVLTAGVARRLRKAQFLDWFEKSPALRSLVFNHLDFLLFQAQQNALCHALHSIEERLCRWLLQASDARSGDTVEVTQEFCAHIMGVQRTSLSMVAHGLQEAGSIRTMRGKISILDRARLENAACECYAKSKQHMATEAALAARLPLRAQQPDGGGRESETPAPATCAA